MTHEQHEQQSGAVARRRHDDLSGLLDPVPARREQRFCLVPGLMDTIKPRRIKDGSTTEVPGGASGASDQVDGRTDRGF